MKTAILIGTALLACAAAFAQAANSYTQTNLVTNSKDPHMVNPWGITRPVLQSAGDAHWWTADQATGLSTVYQASGTVLHLVITVPPASGTGPGSPSGATFLNKTFVFATLDGTISKWFAGEKPAVPGKACSECHVTNATMAVNRSAAGAVYTGITVAERGKQQTFFAANNSGSVEAFAGKNFTPVRLPAGAFVDPGIPSGYTPFGMQAVGATIYVTFSKGGSHSGYVDAFDTNGTLLFGLEQGWFDEPWGIAPAPANFGAFSNALLVANKGSGWIAAFDPATHHFLGFLQDSGGSVITNPGLWGIEFGAGNKASGPTNVLYLSAGGSTYTTGLFAAIAAN